MFFYYLSGHNQNQIDMKKFLPFFFALLFSITSFGQEVCSNYFPSVSPDGNYLYFTSDRVDNTYKIYRCNINGTDVQRVTSTDFVELHPRLSPDGSKIVFQAGGYDNTAEIYVIDVDGSNLTRLTNNNRYDGMPCFSPDGETIVFDGWDDSPYPEIFIMNADGTGRVQLTNETGAYWQSAPVFNPSGDQIYFLEGLNADNHIMRMNPDGSDWKEITPPNEFGYAETYLNFRPDGGKLIFTTSEWTGYGGYTDIVTCDPGGGDWNRLTNGEKYSYSACYSPDGSQIYYANDQPNPDYKWDINKMNPDGSDKTMVVSCSNLGVEEPQAGNSLLFCQPNPMVTTGHIELSIDRPGEVLFTIFDLSGKAVHADYSIDKDGITIERGNMHSGVYLFRIISESAHLGTGKIIIQ